MFLRIRRALVRGSAFSTLLALIVSTAGLPALGTSADTNNTLRLTEPVVERRRLNTCFGGLSEGKYIVPEGWVSERTDSIYRKQTTLSECAAEGGLPGWLPRLDNPVRDTKLV